VRLGVVATDRSIRFFGEDGQEKLRNASVTVIGVGGIGRHVVQQLAFLGVGSIAVVDAEELAETNRNRYVTSQCLDPIPGTAKVEIAERLIQGIDPTVKVVKIEDSLVSGAAFKAVVESDYVFGCVDSEGARMVLTELCAAYARPYFDTASDIEAEDRSRYGGRVCVAWKGESCLVCLDQLDMGEAQRELGGPEARKLHKAIYGVEVTELGRTGPSVVSINGVVASLAVTEFMLGVTGIREPKKLLTYRSDIGEVLVSRDEQRKDCYYCKGIWGRGDEVDVQRYLRSDLGRFLR
jgi:molybdopterin/thiamine biosynthesis adenylyltransferase